MHQAPQNPFTSFSKQDLLVHSVYLHRTTHLHVGQHDLLGVSGLQLNLAASRAQLVGPAVSYALGQGATMISAAWGVFLWREFRNAPTDTGRWLTLMFALFLAGLGMIAHAPMRH